MIGQPIKGRWQIGRWKKALQCRAFFALSANWQPRVSRIRGLGIAVQNKNVMMQLLDNWKAQGCGRHIDAIELREYLAPLPQDDIVWWVSPDDGAKS
jgi:hypothetical protein